MISTVTTLTHSNLTPQELETVSSRTKCHKLCSHKLLTPVFNTGNNLIYIGDITPLLDFEGHRFNIVITMVPGQGFEQKPRVVDPEGIVFNKGKID